MSKCLKSGTGPAEKSCMTMILAVLLSFNAHAGWFGPSDSDVAVTPVTGCSPGEAGFKIENKSHTQVDKVSFDIVGKQDGHSTEYNLSQGPVDVDEILKPGASTKICFDLRNMDWPDNKQLHFSAKEVSVTFAD